MQRLVAFLENNLHILLFIALQSACLYLLFSLNPYQRAYFSNSSSEVTARVNNFSSGIHDYFALADQNELLQDHFLTQFDSSSTTQLSFLGTTVNIQDSSTNRMFTSIPAQVVYNTVHKADNIFIINKGTNHGVEKNMGVVSPQGVAGIVLDARANFSQVMSVLNTNFGFTPQINSVEYYSSIRWQNKSPNTMAIERINSLEDIHVGDVVSTGRSSVLFPPQIPIGVLSDLKKKSNSQYFETTFKTTTDFRKLEYVFVLKNNYKKDIEELIPNGN